MRVLLTLAWRNVWRNTRRTTLTIAALAVAMFLVVVMSGMNNGQYAQAIEMGVRRSTGHIQVHRKGYWDEKTLKHALLIADADTASMRAIPHVTGVSAKLAVDALVGAGSENTVGAQVIGVAPSAEAAMTVFSEPIFSEGGFLADGDTTGVVIGYAMARNLGAGVGDTLSLLTQARDGSMAAALVAVKGIFQVSEPEMDGYTVIAHLALMQEILAAEGRATAIALTVDDHRAVEGVMAVLARRFLTGDGAQQWEVMSYEELLPVLMQTIAFDNAGGAIFEILLLVVIVFGILNTVLMSVLERFHEFGVMMALGTRRRTIAAMVFFEAICLSVVGLAIGNVLGYLLNRWWAAHPISLLSLGKGYGSVGETLGYPLVIAPVADVHQQAVWSALMLGMTLAVVVWPVWTAVRFRPVEAIRQA